MNKDKLSTVVGLLGAVATLAHQSGITVGHFAGTDFVPLVSAVSLAVLGWLTGKPAGITK